MQLPKDLENLIYSFHDNKWLYHKQFQCWIWDAFKMGINLVPFNWIRNSDREKAMLGHLSRKQFLRFIDIFYCNARGSKCLFGHCEKYSSITKSQVRAL